MSIKGLELIKKAMKLEEADRIPWVPFVGCHAGHLLGITALDYLRSTNRIIEGVNKAIELYNPDGRPMPHDECPMAIALKEGRTIQGVEAIAERPDGTRRAVRARGGVPSLEQATGVMPFWSTFSGSAPASRRILTTSGWPLI
mgnify:CR=1 FL=1